MFSKILIANRGEIACRVIRTARKMNIGTVAVYSQADARAVHVRMADEAVYVGGPAATDSYLRVERILQAVTESGAEAVHPGYGFLSENAEFALALEAAGIAFIGPGIKAITHMGDKIAAKKLAQEAGVNTIPGFTDVIEDSDHALKVANEIGYPVMLKASAGGGGKGMRVVWDDDACREGFDATRSEALASFADERIFAEKYVEEPRHIEIQVLADKHGNSIYLGERECSIQRRHQKVIEEAPSPFLDEATRKAMGEQAITLANAVDYSSAGTVEFIVDAKRNFYFLEMNTRLQVEHPVTEFITGEDLVEHMIRIAAGEKLSLSQSDVKFTGWALEVRVYAEDPFRNFAPSSGRLARYIPPAANDHVRVDSGFEEGSAVSVYYDPMIAKLVTHGGNREQAIERMADALDAYYIRGVSHNLSFLNALIAHPRFKEGRLSTNFIADEFPDGFHVSDVPQADPLVLVAIAGVVHLMELARATHISGQTRRFERQPREDWVVIANRTHYPVKIEAHAQGFAVHHQELVYRITTDWLLGNPVLEAEVNGVPTTVQVDRGAGYRLGHRGAQLDATVLSPRAASLTAHMIEREAPDLSKLLLSPMPGLLVRLSVTEGAEVKVGEELAAVEAMKMENSLRAPDNVVIAKILVAQGDSLELDQTIMEFE